MDPLLKLIGRQTPLFSTDINQHQKTLQEVIGSSSFLVLGGGGTIGQAVTKQIFQYCPKKLHVVDISENNLVELVRDLRSDLGYIEGDFKTFALDIGSSEFDAFIAADGQYDYWLNLSALKHVRSEKDPYTLMRMLQVNVFNTEKTLHQAVEHHAKKYFCVSTDKAAAPHNLMGASKRIMEMHLLNMSQKIPIATARFANVAFSDGSLLHGFNQRLNKRQPIAAPSDIKRYFVTPKESGQLCLLACIFGENRNIFFPKNDKRLPLVTFPEIAKRFLASKGFDAYECDSEEAARQFFCGATSDANASAWPCFFSASDTTGEKPVEQFYTDDEKPDFDRFTDIGVIENAEFSDHQALAHFSRLIRTIAQKQPWNKAEIADAIRAIVPEMQHEEIGKSLEQKM